jgi:hypothetical protein
MASETLIKCSHPPCQCLIEAEQQFCSADCASARGAARGPCLCGHVGCVAEPHALEGPPMIDKDLEPSLDDGEPDAPASSRHE